MAGKVILSARMQAVADMVTKGNRVCDVGCDHGYVSIYLILNKISPKALAMDVNQGPLMRASEHVTEAGLMEYITLRLSDGLTAYREGEADTLICAGMGGRLMQKILAKEPSKTGDFQELILQPQSEIPFFRSYLRSAGYSIVWEDMVLEEDKFYPVIKAVFTESPGQFGDWELEKRFGPVLLKNRHPVLKEYLKREWQNSLTVRTGLLKARDSERTRRRMRELEEEAGYLREAARQMGMDWDKGGLV